MWDRLTSIRACSAVGSAPEWHSGGHRFDPGQVHHPSLMIAVEGCRAVASQATRRRAPDLIERATARQATRPSLMIAGEGCRAVASQRDAEAGPSRHRTSYGSASHDPSLMIAGEGCRAV